MTSMAVLTAGVDRPGATADLGLGARPLPGPPDQPDGTGPPRSPPVPGPSGPGRCWSWPPRPRPRCGPAGSASRRRPGSGWSPRCRVSCRRCTWTRPSPCPSAWKRTPRTRCGPGWPPSPRSAAGPAGSPSGRRSAPSRSAWPGRWPTTCWPSPGRRGHRGRSPRSCPACRSWSWPWGPRWPICCAPMPAPQTRRATGPQDQQYRGPQAGPRTRLVRPGPGRTSGSPGRVRSFRRAHDGPAVGPRRQGASIRPGGHRPGPRGRQQARSGGKAGIQTCPAQRGNQGLQPGPGRPGAHDQRRAARQSSCPG